MAAHSGLAMVTHYCGGMAVETQIVVGHGELYCGMLDMEGDCKNESSTENHFRKKPCCENEYQSFDQETEFQLQIINSSVNLEFVTVFFITLADKAYTSEIDEAEYLNYSPPLIERDIPVLVQSFLI